MTGLTGRGRGSPLPRSRRSVEMRPFMPAPAAGTTGVQSREATPLVAIWPIGHGPEACCRLVGQVAAEDPQRFAGNVKTSRRWSRQGTVTSVTRVTASTSIGDARLSGQTCPVTFRRPCVTVARGR